MEQENIKTRLECLLPSFDQLGVMAYSSIEKYHQTISSIKSIFVSYTYDPDTGEEIKKQLEIPDYVQQIISSLEKQISIQKKMAQDIVVFESVIDNILPE